MTQREWRTQRDSVKSALVGEYKLWLPDEQVDENTDFIAALANAVMLQAFGKEYDLE